MRYVSIQNLTSTYRTKFEVVAGIEAGSLGMQGMYRSGYLILYLRNKL